MKVCFNILIAGVGGQGVLLTSKIIAEAALLQVLDVKQSEVHGMAQRGGSVLSQVRFGVKVFSPIVAEGEADLLIGFEPLETARYLHFLKADSIVVYNTRPIGTHWLDDGKSGPKPNWKVPYIRLFPYSDTTNPGGVYILAIYYIGDGSSYPVEPRDCKYDAFKVKKGGKLEYSVYLSGMKFEDLYADGVKDPADPGLAGWTINISGAGIGLEDRHPLDEVSWR